MDQLDWGVIIQIITLLGSAGGVYAAIRSDLVRIHERHAALADDHKELKGDFKDHVKNNHCHRRTDD